MSDDAPVPTVGPVCDRCSRMAHEECRGCKGCGCFVSALTSAAKGPKLPDPETYQGAPDA